MIGPAGGGRRLTVVVTQPDALFNCYVITAWPASTAEQTLYERPGGNRDAQFSPV